jgi:hypothetical protein
MFSVERSSVKLLIIAKRVTYLFEGFWYVAGKLRSLNYEFVQMLAGVLCDN